MRNLLIIVQAISITTLLSCGVELPIIEQENETYYFLTTLGSDTLAIEKIVESSDSIQATVVLRAPNTKIMSYGFAKGQEQGVFFKGVIDDPVRDNLVSTQVAKWQDDSLLISMNQGDKEKLLVADKHIVPFIDMVHWPFELMLKNLKETTTGTLTQQVWSGTRTFNFELKRLNEDSVTIKHPSRGMMGVKLNTNGQLEKLDASQTTRKLMVTRIKRLDFDSLGEKFIQAEKAGIGFGALSGRGVFEETINGITYKIDFGTPVKRDREIWGSLVRYGDRWRTGANRATHFSVDRNIKLNEMNVPAGDYTLFSIPGDSSLTLIINNQTGQNGQTYDETRDLGRVEMSRRNLDKIVEVFNVKVFLRDGEAYLSLEWDDRAYEARIN